MTARDGAGDVLSGRRQQVTVVKLPAADVSRHRLPSLDSDRFVEHRPVVDERVELAVLLEGKRVHLAFWAGEANAVAKLQRGRARSFLVSTHGS